MGDRVRPVLIAVGRVLFFVALLALPSLARAGYYYRRPYGVVQVPRPDLTKVQVPQVETAVFVKEDALRGEGRVVIDRAHDNAVRDTELNILLSRLTTRGMQTVTLTPDMALADVLRTAAALIVVSPHQSFSPQETEAVERFVEQGGRVLLAGDPSRYDFEVQVDELYGEFYLARSDVAAINSLASAFGLTFADDYVYNTKENGGNYQYVMMRDFSPSPVTSGLKQVVFYAAHSLIASEGPLITADSETTSSLSEQSGGLVTMALGGGGQVLAVGDFTFMTEPYNAVADNNRLIANIADLIAGADRTFGLTEFPRFFGDSVDLVPVWVRRDDVAFSAGAVREVARLQAALQSADKALNWRGQPDRARDTLYLGLYEGIDLRPEVGEILARNGITFTLETVARQLAELTPSPTPRYTPTPTPTPTPTAASDVSPTPTPTARPLRDWIHFPGVGPVDAKENVLLYQNEEDGRQVLIVLAFSEVGLGSASSRLLDGDLSGCLLDDDRKGDPQAISLALCPTAYEPWEVQATPTPMPDDVLAPPTPAALGSVLIVSDDDGEGVYEWWTSAYQFYDIVGGTGYEPLIWSTNTDGAVTLEQLRPYGAVLWCTGDYQDEGGNPSAEELEWLGQYLSGGGNVLLIGAFLGDPEGRERGLLLDVQLARPDHPLAKGFDPGYVIVLERFTAETDYAPYRLTDVEADAAVWTRGPASEYAGEPAIAVLADDLSEGRLALVGVPLYLFPYEDGVRLGNDIFSWLVGEP